MHYAQSLLFMFILCGSGCSLSRISTLTESAPVSIPSHTARNQFSSQIGYGGKRGFDGSLSYALTNHVALGGSAFINQQIFQDNPLPGWSDGYALTVNSVYWEGQASYFRTVGKSSVWALTGGYGSGSRQLRWIENQLDARYGRYFIQTSYSRVGPSNRQVGIGVKLHNTRYGSASLQEQTIPNISVLTRPHRGVLGIDVAQTVHLPLSSILAFSGQLGVYVPLGQVRLATTSGSSINGYNNLGLIATAGFVLSLPKKR